MNLAAIFALLLASGTCAQTTFQGEDGTRLEVIVCPRTVVPEGVPDAAPEGGEVPQKGVGRRT